MADKKKVAKGAGAAYALKKVTGKVVKLAVVAAVGAAIVKVLKNDN